MSTNQIVKPKIDVVFKKLFGDPANEHILKAFIAGMLGIDKNRITEISFDNVEMIPDFADEKFGRVDVKPQGQGEYRTAGGVVQGLQGQKPVLLVETVYIRTEEGITLWKPFKNDMHKHCRLQCI